MNDRYGGDRLTEVLRALAREDATAGASPRVEARLRDVVRALRPTRRAPRPAFLALAAALTAVAGGSTWVIATHAPEPARTLATREVATEFLPLAFGHLPVTDAYIVRLEVPRSALVQFGLAAADLPAAGNETIDADVLVGMDGIARAVRFVHQVNGGE